MVKAADGLLRKIRDYAKLLSPAERQAWNLPTELTVSEWAEKNRVLSDRAASEGGSWKNDRTPYLREIMDSWSDPSIRQVTFKKSAQIGGTEAAINMMGRTIAQDPGPMLMVLPKEGVAKKISRKRIWPMITETPSLQRFLPYNSDDLSRMFYGLANMDITLASAESPSDLASDPIKYLLLDEVNKYPRFSGKESDPISLAKERLTTFKYDKKTFVASTPTLEDEPIDFEYKNSDQRQYHVPCPHCGEYQILKWPQIKFDSSEHPKVIKKYRKAYYQCLVCKDKVNDSHKEEMLARGVWCPEGCKVNNKGKIVGDIPETDHRGYWINALYSPWLNFADLASEFLECGKDEGKLMNFMNSKLAEEWKVTVEDTQEDRVKKLIASYPKDYCPAGVKLLIGELDVQKGHFWLSIRGWGFNQENWLILSKRVETWREVEALFFDKEYKHQSQTSMPVTMAVIDTGYRADEVYEFCAKWYGRTMAVKGKDDMKGIPMRHSKIDRLPDGTPLDRGIILWLVNKFYYNDKINRFLTSTDRDTGQTHLHSKTSDNYIKQICSEHKTRERDRNGRVRLVWKLKSGVRQNHYRDCMAYGFACADMLKVWTLSEEDFATPQQSRPEDTRGRRSGNKWLGNRRIRLR